MPAYNINYVDDISDLQETLFQEITRYKYEIDYEKFVEGYMECKYRQLLDKGNARIANMTWDELLSYIERDCKGIIVKGDTNIDRLQSGWIGRMYSLLQYKKNITSDVLYDRLPLEKMKTLFVPLHTVAEDVALDKIEKIL
ncbi:MAG: hypothetical protein IJ455_00225 [Agathobacter sp.]|nr:hypothetical protein [Agathobacter sp.]